MLSNLGTTVVWESRGDVSSVELLVLYSLPHRLYETLFLLSAFQSKIKWLRQLSRSLHY